MPGYDGTGPAGMGPLTGGGRGLCTPYGARYPRWMPRALRGLGRWNVGRGFWRRSAFGRGFGVRRGGGRGRGRW